ncbi:MAG: Cof-type HAD-IIB family hydrolase [Clostridiaceae bacterium]
MVKLICLDIDGTLLNTSREVTDRTIRAIEMARKKGIIVTIASGRIHQSVLTIADAAGISAPIISMNGSLIKDKESGKILRDIPIGFDKVRDSFKVLKRLNIKPNLYDKNGMYISSRFEMYRDIHGLIKSKYNLDYTEMEGFDDIEKVILDKGDSLNKIIFFPGREKRIETMAEFSPISDISVVSSSRSNVEITNILADKGKAVVALGEILGIYPDEIMAVGDQFNDQSMLNAVKYSVAMGNAPDELKKDVYYITKDNDSDGCALAIEKIALEMN